MKIKIIKAPGFRGSGFSFPPLGIAVLYSCLKARGFDITQDDLNVVNHAGMKPEAIGKLKNKLIGLFTEKGRMERYLGGGNDWVLEKITRRYLKKTNLDGVDILLISVSDSDFCSAALSLLIARYFKQGKNRLVVTGGESSLKAYICENFELYNKMGIIDYHVMGFGEKASGMLMEKIILGSDIAFKDIPGLYYSEGGSIHANSYGSQALTTPNFDGLPLDRYVWKSIKFREKVAGEAFADKDILILPFQMINGCPYRCAFCGYSFYPTIYSMPVAKAVDDLKKLSEQYNTKYFFFLHNTINFADKFIGDFCDEVIKNNLNIYWSDCASARNINSPDIIFKMRKAGACRLVFGMETGSPRMLKFINKGITIEQTSRVFKWAHKAGIWISLEIIAGLPHEEDKDIRQTVEFINNNLEYIDDIWLTKYYLCPGSLMFHMPHNYGIENIRECLYEKRPATEVDTGFFIYAFDETRGLKWEDKKDQIDYSYGIIEKLRYNNRKIPWYKNTADINILFYLYSCLSDKADIRRYYKQYRPADSC